MPSNWRPRCARLTGARFGRRLAAPPWQYCETESPPPIRVMRSFRADIRSLPSLASFPTSFVRTQAEFGFWDRTSSPAIGLLYCDSAGLGCNTYINATECYGIMLISGTNCTFGGYVYVVLNSFGALITMGLNPGRFINFRVSEKLA